MRLFLIILLGIAGVWIGSSTILHVLNLKALPMHKAGVLFDKIAKGGIGPADFASDEPLARACVERIKLSPSFIQKIEARFGDDAVQDFNFAVKDGKLPHVLWWPDKIEPERIQIQRHKDGVFLFSYPNLGFWPVSKDDGWKICLTKYLSDKNEDIGNYRRRLDREIHYLAKGISLIETDPGLTIETLRMEMEKAFMEFK